MAGTAQEAQGMLKAGCGLPMRFMGQVVATDEYILGCTVPRRLRKGNRRRLQSVWPSHVVEEHYDRGFHEDEREALEALCFLSCAGFPITGVMQPPAGSGQRSTSAEPKEAIDQQAQQQQSKASCETAVHADGDCRAATAYQLARQYSPSSDVSSGAYHAALVLQDAPHIQPQEQPVDMAEDIHPAALLPSDTCMTQTASAATHPLASNTQLQWQQQQQRQCLIGAGHWQQQHTHQVLEQDAPQQLVSAGCLQHMEHSSVAQPAAVLAPEQQLQALLASEPAKHIAAAAPPPWAAGNACQPACLGMSAASQLCSASGVMPLVQQQLLAAVTAQGCGLAPASAFSVAFLNMLLSAGLPSSALQLLVHLHQQQQHVGDVCVPQQQAAGSHGGGSQFPVRGGQMHVYIAHMIARGGRQEQQQQQPKQVAKQVAADEQQPQAASTTGYNICQPQQQLAICQASAQAHVPEVIGSWPKVRPASEGTADKAARKKLKQSS